MWKHPIKDFRINGEKVSIDDMKFGETKNIELVSGSFRVKKDKSGVIDVEKIEPTPNKIN